MKGLGSEAIGISKNSFAIKTDFAESFCRFWQANRSLVAHIYSLLARELWQFLDKKKTKKSLRGFPMVKV